MIECLPQAIRPDSRFRALMDAQLQATVGGPLTPSKAEEQDAITVDGMVH